MELSTISAGLGPTLFALACAFALLAGFVKGVSGFAMPMILVSGLGSFLSPELALAGLLLPTLATNLLQALRDGPRAALRSVAHYRLFLGTAAVCLLASAQLVRSIDARVLYLLIGVPIVGFALLQLAGYRARISDRARRPAELGLGALAGAIGGISGVWGPPLVLYLTARDTPKSDQMRVQGVAFGLGAILLVAAHIQTGVLNRETLPFSAAMLVPALLGMAFGRRVHDSIDQAMFRRITLLVLIVAGLNLLRRALF